MESCKSDKKNIPSPYQQSFRIDDLLTRRAIEQQPDHFSSLHSPTKVADHSYKNQTLRSGEVSGLSSQIPSTLSIPLPLT